MLFCLPQKRRNATPGFMSKRVSRRATMAIRLLMPKVISTAKFVALLSLRVDLGRPRRIPDPLPKAKEIVISDWPGKNAQLLLRLIRGLAGKDEVYSLRDVDGMDHETLSLALGLTMASINGSYTNGQWQRAAEQIEKAVKTLRQDQCP